MRRSRRPSILTALAVLPALLRAPAAVAHGPRDLPSEDKTAPEASDKTLGLTQEQLSIHYQFTAATQYHPAFAAKYTGQNSMSADSESATAVVTTLFIDARAWRGAELLFNPEMSGGTGLSATKGVAAFPNGIVYRVGNPAPAIYIARLALSQTFNLGGGMVLNEEGPNELSSVRSRDVLAVTVGRFSVVDVVDGNRYANDATTEFFNWALFASGAYDYPADTRGYTYGALADLAKGWWSVRGGIALEPYYANLAQMDWRITVSHGLMGEYEARYNLRGRPGASSLLLFRNTARMGSYQQLLANPAGYNNDIAATRADGRTKYGFALSVEQQITDTMGAFLRASWNDGHNESWAFTEIDRSFALGVTQNGRLWRRPNDIVGAAVVASGLSPWHEQYLAGGGYGFIIGDGALNYGLEVIGDLYYKLQINEMISLSAIYQPIVNPAYNKDRGPINVFSGRLHVAF
jgi:high affinity Mn2+ porin